ncbi:hypothetical protein SAMN04487891_1023 [Flagellimonas taeanensis]|uniref:Uncharacterized protein n=1 Tax=Flagellimonas taeanensis TaxID=1005926 RepID=A0A1M6R9Z0_9FLAO|nr:hypothetical protein SAMN04487891_1023 [Allomuricauda taeanensis]SHK29148.1 hypothetical protein SAMN05216293_0678 [Allomuricauda taeanensis]
MFGLRCIVFTSISNILKNVIKLFFGFLIFVDLLCGDSKFLTPSAHSALFYPICLITNEEPQCYLKNCLLHLQYSALDTKRSLVPRELMSIRSLYRRHIKFSKPSYSWTKIATISLFGLCFGPFIPHFFDMMSDLDLEYFLYQFKNKNEFRL